MVLQLTGLHEFQTIYCPIEYSHAVATCETRLVADTVDVGVLLIERAAQSAAGSLVARTGGIGRCAKDETS